MSSIYKNPINISDINEQYTIPANTLVDSNGKDQYLDIRKREGVWQCRVVSYKPFGGAYATLNKIYHCLKESTDLTDSNKALFNNFIDIIVKRYEKHEAKVLERVRKAREVSASIALSALCVLTHIVCVATLAFGYCIWVRCGSISWWGDVYLDTLPAESSKTLKAIQAQLKIMLANPTQYHPSNDPLAEVTKGWRSCSELQWDGTKTLSSIYGKRYLDLSEFYENGQYVWKYRITDEKPQGGVECLLKRIQIWASQARDLSLEQKTKWNQIANHIEYNAKRELNAPIRRIKIFRHEWEGSDGERTNEITRQMPAVLLPLGNPSPVQKVELVIAAHRELNL